MVNKTVIIMLVGSIRFENKIWYFDVDIFNDVLNAKTIENKNY